MSASAANLSRLQFALTMGYHILWPTLTIGLAAFIVILNGLWLRTGDQIYATLLRFWIRVFAIAFGMGVVTGVFISYQIGTNWSGYARATADVLAPLFTYEVLTAFFLEAGFIGILLYGRDRVSPRLYFVSSVIVLAGALLSAFWIIAANSWMQTPSAFHLATDGHIAAVSFWSIVFSPSFPYRYVHMVLASFISGAFFVVGSSCFWLLVRKSTAEAHKALSLSLWLLLFLVPLQFAAGDAQGQNTRKFQPIKLAAIEGRWQTARRVPITLFAIPRQDQERNDFFVQIPRLGSLILTHSWDGEVIGLKSVPAALRPPVLLVFFAFRVMVGCGIVMLLVVLCGNFLRWRGRLTDSRWFLIICCASTPLGFVATLAGWTVTEVGRQPFVVYGVLRTMDAASPVAIGAIGTSLVVLLLLYNLLLVCFVFYIGRMVWRGPKGAELAQPWFVRGPIARIAFNRKSTRAQKLEAG
jgi:cytochrome bd ubiquinol oxidase subunit I